MATGTINLALKAEWIGSNVKILYSRNKSYNGLEGKVVDETKNTFTIFNEKFKGNTKKKVMKRACVFQVNLNGKKYAVEGKFLEKRPEERIKLTT